MKDYLRFCSALFYWRQTKIKEESKEDPTKGTITGVGLGPFIISGSIPSLTYDKGIKKNGSF
jgi:hypothetical protein